MGYNFRPYAQEQMYLMPPSIMDWVSEGSLACFVSEVMDEMDGEGKLVSFYARYRGDGWGNAPYHPLMMVKILVYGYCVGVTSSRRIAQALENDISFRYLATNQQPDFRTISDFRKEHWKALKTLFVEVLALCREAGLAKMGRVALDGRRVAANAALDQNRDAKGIAAEVRRILEEAERVDAEEDQRYGKDCRGDELPEALRTQEGRLARLKEARRRLEEAERQSKEQQAKKLKARQREEEPSGQKKRGRKPKPPDEVVDKEAKVNIADPDSRILKTRRGWVQGYNGQAVADCDSQVIVAQDVTQDENDVHQLGPMVARCEEQAGQRPTELLADAGYWSEENAKLEDEHTEFFIATKKDWKQRKALREKGPPRGRIPKDAPPRDLMERKLLTRRGRKAYKERGPSIEAVFGQMAMRGLSRFWLRGAEKVKTEWSLWCTTHNLLKLWRSGWSPAGAQGIG
jgi:transposase